MTAAEPVDPSRPEQNSAWEAFNTLLASTGGTVTPTERAVVNALQLSDMDTHEIELLTELLRNVLLRARAAPGK